MPAVDAREALGEGNTRDDIEGFPEVSEVEAIRHFTRLSTWNYSRDLLRLLKVGDRDADGDGAGRIPLGLGDEPLQQLRTGPSGIRSGGANQGPILKRAAELALRLPATLRSRVPIGLLCLGFEPRSVSILGRAS